MDRRRVQTIEELEELLQSFVTGVVFRGQTRHFVTSDGTPNIPTSFARHGCVPALMLKWAHYAGTSIQALAGPDSSEPTLELKQAILQHYGWRSFYVDVTTSASVAAWFASHRFTLQRQVHLCEDCFEDPVFVGIEQASYEPSQEKVGHIYVISNESASITGSRLIDLGAEVSSDESLRFHAQSACLLGPYTHGLPASAIVAHLSVPTELLAAYAHKEGLIQTTRLFPPRHKDPLLRILLATPWVQMPVDVVGTPVFRRGLSLPEYDEAFIKHRPASDAFFKEEWIDENRGDQTFLTGALFVRMGEYDFYGDADYADMQLPKTTELLKMHRLVVIELDGLVRFGELADKSVYVKGVALQMSSDGIEVSALSVEHPGLVLEGVGVERGWFYRHDEEARWVRKKDARECPCNAHHRHRQHLVVIHKLEAMLTKSKPSIDRSLSLDLRH